MHKFGFFFHNDLNFFNSNDNDFIIVGLGGMGYSHRSYKKTIPNYKFIKSRFQTRIFKIYILQVVMFQNVLMDPKILKEKEIFLFFSMFFGIFVFFKKKFESLCFSNFIHMFTRNFIQM
jgi:hypothetical protein